GVTAGMVWNQGAWVAGAALRGFLGWVAMGLNARQAWRVLRGQRPGKLA
ncbi:MAG: hypothetical protein JWM80_2253, partial [Cyanobacteria bacterium RYN_339]|nr:hypothetical protein [Cyanobacteria bacterium RYN_339]